MSMIALVHVFREVDTSTSNAESLNKRRFLYCAKIPVNNEAFSPAYYPLGIF